LQRASNVGREKAQAPSFQPDVMFSFCSWISGSLFPRVNLVPSLNCSRTVLYSPAPTSNVQIVHLFSSSATCFLTLNQRLRWRLTSPTGAERSFWLSKETLASCSLAATATPATGFDVRNQRPQFKSVESIPFDLNQSILTPHVCMPLLRLIEQWIVLPNVLLMNSDDPAAAQVRGGRQARVFVLKMLDFCLRLR
jgi:hypothetical protein